LLDGACIFSRVRRFAARTQPGAVLLGLALVLGGGAAAGGPAAPDSYGVPVPAGYRLQVLEATDGRIAVPQDWHYASHGTPSGWMYTFSPEDPAGEYETGLRIQMFVGVEKALQQSRQAFAQAFLRQQRAAAVQVLKECPVEDFGKFQRQCLEVIESLPHGSAEMRFHILYSLMWLKDMDIVAASTFGAPQDQWDRVKEVPRHMAEFVLIGAHLGEQH